jgi:PhnB protein
LYTMAEQNNPKITNAVFITFSGNCKKALTFYQACFGGVLQFETFGKELKDYPDILVVNGSLVSDRIIIHGSDLVHDEGRKLGNYISIFLLCKNTDERKLLIEKLESAAKDRPVKNYDDQKLVELTDAFDVRWVLGV